MKDKILKICYFVYIANFFFPWFTFNAKTMGYCFGINFAAWFIVPVLLIGMYLFKNPDKRIWKILAEVSIVVDLVLLVLAVGKWQEVSNIQEGFYFKDGFLTAVPTFWVSVAVHILFAVLLQGRRQRRASERRQMIAKEAGEDKWAL